MKYVARFLKNEIGELSRNNVRLEAVGQIYRLPEFVQEQLAKTKAALAKNTGLTLILALSYGGRTEIVEATRAIAQQVKSGSGTGGTRFWRHSSISCLSKPFLPAAPRMGGWDKLVPDYAEQLTAWLRKTLDERTQVSNRECALTRTRRRGAR